MKPTTSNFDLRQMVLDHIYRVGAENAAVFFGVTLHTVNNWKRRPESAIPVSAAQKLVDMYFRHECQSVQFGGLVGDKVAVFLIGDNRPSQATAICIAGLQKCLGEKMQLHAMPEFHRNDAATVFYQSDANWSLWLESDCVFPWGEPNQFNATFGANIPGEQLLDVFSKLTSSGNDLVSALHFDPFLNQGCAGFYEAMQDGGNNDENRHAHRDAPNDVKQKTRYFEPGCFVAHRRVFEAIESKLPEVKPTYHNQPYGFFTPTYREHGPVAAFCLRAKAAGITPVVDFGCIVGRVGDNFGRYTFWHHNTHLPDSKTS